METCRLLETVEKQLMNEGERCIGWLAVCAEKCRKIDVE